MLNPFGIQKVATNLTGTSSAGIDLKLAERSSIYVNAKEGTIGTFTVQVAPYDIDSLYKTITGGTVTLLGSETGEALNSIFNISNSVVPFLRVKTSVTGTGIDIYAAYNS